MKLNLDQEFCQRIEPHIRRTIAQTIAPLLTGHDEPRRKDLHKKIPKLPERALVLSTILMEFGASLCQTFLLKSLDEDSAEEAFLDLALQAWRAERERHVEPTP